MARATIPRLIVAIGWAALLFGAMEFATLVLGMEPQAMFSVLVVQRAFELLSAGVFAVVVGIGLGMLHRVMMAAEAGAWRRG